MRRRLLMTAAALLVAAPAWASLALTLCTVERCVLASDSRTWDTARDVAGGDTARKVDVRDGYALAMTGWPGVFEAWQRTPPRPGESARALAQRVLDAVVPDDEPQDFTLLVVRLGDTYAAKVRLQPDGRRTILQDAAPDAPYTVALGWDSGGAERDGFVQFIQRELTTTTPSEARLVEMATGVLTAAARQSVKVGGPSHIAILDAAGARWHSLKDVHWDGTNLTIGQGVVAIDQTGITVLAAQSGTGYEAANAYRFTGLADTDAGLSALSLTNNRTLFSQVEYAGAHNASMIVEHDLSSVYGPTSGGGTAGIAQLRLLSTHNNASIVLNTTVGASPNAGTITLGGIPNFQGATSGSAGSIAGYINILVNGTAYRIAVYNP